MKSNDTTTLEVSGRDISYLLSLNLAYTAYVNWMAGKLSDDRLVQNENALDAMFAYHYSADEANALLERIKKALPSDTPIILAAPASGSTYVH